MNTSSARAASALPCAFLLLAWALFGTEATAQSRPSFDLWDKCSDAASCSLFRRVAMIDQDGSFLVKGTLGIGNIPASGDGLRTMWYPFKGAFRTGSAGDEGSGSTAWDDPNIGFYSFAGGIASRASAFSSFAFGDRVVVTGTDATGFGGSSTVSGTAAFSAGANHNCTGFACVTLGYTNRASGQGSVAIGYRSIAPANYSVAIGHRATACDGTRILSSDISNSTCPGVTRAGAIVFADQSTTDYIGASANNQFNVRAAGGYRLFSNSSLTSGVTMSAGGSAWNVVSDRDQKEQFADLDGDALLQRILLLPVQTWRYIDEEDRRVRHVGPTAQDWQALIAGPLDLNDETLTINQGDYDGVNLAAIKALAQRSARLDAENSELRAEVRDLQEERLAVREQLGQLQAMVASLAAGTRAGEVIAERQE